MIPWGAGGRKQRAGAIACPLLGDGCRAAGGDLAAGPGRGGSVCLYGVALGSARGSPAWTRGLTDSHAFSCRESVVHGGILLRCPRVPRPPQDGPLHT